MSETTPKPRRRARRAALVTVGVAGAAAAGLAAARRTLHRQRGLIDPAELSSLAELPPDDLGTVRSADGTGLTVRAAGPPDAPAVVLVHGFSLDMTMWHHQWKALSDRYRVIVYDQRGHGRSERGVDSDYSLQAMAADLEAVLDATVGDGPCVVAGHSMGGMALLAFADEHPQEFGGRIVAAGLFDTAAAELLSGIVGALGARLEMIFRPRVRAALSVRDRAERIRGMIQSRGEDLAYGIAKLTNFGHDAHPAVIEYVTRIAVRAPAEVWTDAIASMLDMDLKDALHSVKVPTLVVVGDLDRLTPPATALALKRSLPDAEMVVFKGAGHIPMLERPDQFNDLFRGFLERHLPAPAKPARRRAAGAKGSA